MQISSPNLIAAMLLTAFVIERSTAAGEFIGSLFRLRGSGAQSDAVTLFSPAEALRGLCHRPLFRFGITLRLTRR